VWREETAMGPTSLKDDAIHPEKNRRGELGDALARIEREVREGVAHGFFDLAISCEIVNGKKRRLTVRSGKSYQFVISLEEVKD
jgi:hypothetical protein